jgi:hypothetical protein
MALSRRNLLLALPLVGVLPACTQVAEPAVRDRSYHQIAQLRRSDAARGTILVCMPETKQTAEVWTGLSDELAGEFDLVAIRVEGREAAPLIAEGIRRHHPSALVLMNNPTLDAYRQYQHTNANAKFPPAVVVMTSFLEGQQRNIVATTGISYEVPLITMVTNLRKLLAKPIERVGVVLRAPFRTFVQHQADLAAREQIRLAAEFVGQDPNPSELKRALRRLKGRADAVWILNDDRLLTPRLIAEAWLPGLNERPWAPTIVGVGALVSPGQSFGTFAVLPDHTALGVQAAGLVFDIAGNDWQVPVEAEVALPLSTTTTVDLAQVRERFLLQGHALEQVDRILE